MLHLTAPALLLACSILSSSPAALAPPAHREATTIQDGSAEFILVADGESNLADLVESYARMEGIRILASTSIRAALSATEFQMFGPPRSLEPTELTAFVEGVLRDSDFILSANGGAGSFTIHGVSNQRPLSLSWVPVPSGEVALLRQHPALLMQTLVTFRNIDARQLSTNLRPVFQNPVYQSIMSLGNSNSILLRGTGLELARAIDLLSEADAAAAGSMDTQAQVQTQSQSEPEPATASQAANVEAPHLVTRIFEIAGETQAIADTAEGLCRGRFKVEARGLLWETPAGDLAAWPAPRFWTDRSTNRVMVQAAERDFEALEADFELAARLHSGAD